MPIELLPSPTTSAPPKVHSLFGRRALAYLMDLALLFVATVAVASVFVFAYSAYRFPGNPGMVAEVARSPEARVLSRSLHVLFYFSYFTISHWYFGRTLGKKALGLRVRALQGDMSFLRALGRSLAYPVSGWITLGLGFLLPLFRADGRALHDLIASTKVAAEGEEQESMRKAA